MNVQVAPVIKDDFVYRDVLLVDAGGDLKRHPRASPADLKPLLDGTAAKDQVGHWYQAQLVHYGLQRTKDKNTAKVRLQHASSQRRLVVPKHLVDLEAQMRKEYASNVRKAKNAVSKAAESGELEGAKGKGKKRKADDGEVASAATNDNKKTRITLHIDGMAIPIDQEAVDAAAKAKGKNATKETATPAKKATTKAQSTTKPADEPQSTTKAKTPKAPKAKAKAEPKAEPKAKSGPKVKAEPKPKAEPKVKKEPATRTPRTKKEPQFKPEPPADDELPHTRNVTGIYNISCPEIEDQYGDDAGNLHFALCVDNERDRIWGDFDLANQTGILRLDGSGVVANETTSLGWRARDTWNNDRLSFGRGCLGEIVFTGVSEIRGTLYNMFPEPVQFYGERRPGPLWCGRTAESFEAEWDGYVQEAYGR